MQTYSKDTNNTQPQYHQIQCAVCRKSFFWHLAYWQSRTPGAQDPAGYDYISRVFCPHCGAIVCTGYGAGSWTWYGDNQLLNANKALPPTLPPDLEWLPDDERGERFMENFHESFGKRQLPRNLWVPVSQQSLDLSSLGTFEEIPFKPRKVPLYKVFFIKLQKYFARLTGKQNDRQYRRQTGDHFAREGISNRLTGKIVKGREAFYHEDDYCLIEVLPIENWDTCLSRLREVGKLADENFNGVGWTDMYIRGDNPHPLERLNINVKDLASSLSKFLIPYDSVITGYSSFRETAEDTIAFGSETSYIIFADYNGFTDIVEDIWLDFGTDIRANKALFMEGLQTLVSLGELLLVDWNSGRVIKLSDQDAIMAYLDLQEITRAHVC